MQQSNTTTYDLIIIGGSAAATSAGIYAARRHLNFKIITKDFGGEVATSGDIGNWPGVVHTDGVSLTGQFRQHLDSYGVDIEEGIVVDKVDKQDDGLFCITTKKASTQMAASKLDTDHMASVCSYLSKTVIIATGVHPRALGVPGEADFRNKGLSYCTVCDGPLFAGKVVATIGGGNSALESALMLSEIAKKVYLININADFKGEQILIKNVKSKPNVEIISSARTKSIHGSGIVSSLEYLDVRDQGHTLDVEGVFVHIGMTPNADLVKEDVMKDEFGQIKINMRGETNIPGLFAAGDVTDSPFKQIVIAAGQGCTALLSAVGYLNRFSSTS